MTSSNWRARFWLLIAIAITNPVTTAAQPARRAVVVPQIGHSIYPPLTALSRDRKYLASLDAFGYVKLWNLERAQVVQSLHKVGEQPVEIAFLADGRSLLAAAQDRALIWDIESANLLRTIEGEGTAVSPDGTHAASYREGELRLWELASGALVDRLKVDGATPKSLAVSRGGRHVAVQSGKDRLFVWKTGTSEGLRLVATEELGDLTWSSNFSISDDGHQILFVTKQSAVALVNIEAARTVVDTKQPYALEGVVFLGNEPMAFWRRDDASLLACELLSGREIVLENLPGEIFGRFRADPDASLILASAVHGKIRSWDMRTGNPIHTLQGRAFFPLSIALSGDGGRLLFGGFLGTIKLWDLEHGRLAQTYGKVPMEADKVALSPTGRFVLGEGGQAVQVWDAATGRPIHTFTYDWVKGNHTGGSFAISPDESRILVASDYYNGSGSTYRSAVQVKLYEGGSFNDINGFTIPDQRLEALIALPRAARIATARGSIATLWDATNGARLYEIEVGKSASIRFSPDGSRLISADRTGNVRLWNAETGELLRSFAGYERQSVAAHFSGDGTVAVLVGNRDYLSAWDLRSGELLHGLRSHNITTGKYDHVLSVAISYDGRRVVMCDKDGALIVWEPKRDLISHRVGSGAPHYIALSQDGRRAVTADADGTARVWNADTGTLEASLVGGIEKQWLALASGGFFAASTSDASDLVAIARGLEITSISQVHYSLFNPDLIRESLAGDPTGEVLRATEAINLDKVLDSGPAPAVAIISHDVGRESETDLVTLQARLIDQGKGIGRIEWRVNGITVAVGAKPTGDGPDYMITQRLALDPGENTIEVVAYNGSNLLASLPARTSIKFTGTPNAVRPILHVLAIGINEYVDRGWTPPGENGVHRFPPLALAAGDASSFASAMKKAGAEQYAEVKVTLVLDDDARAAGLEWFIKHVAAEIHPRDTFVLFAAAHGTSLNGKFYLIPQDYDGGLNPVALQERAIGQDRIQDWVANQIRAKKTIILLDTCESGALISGFARSRTDVPASEAAIGRLHEATGRPVLTAAAEGKPALEGYEGNGVFTWALLDALRNGDSNGNDTIELSELVEHAQDQVAKISAKLNGKGRATFAARGSTEGQQSARFGSRGEDFALVKRLQ